MTKRNSVSDTAARILKSKTASRQEKSLAASALTQRTAAKRSLIRAGDLYRIKHSIRELEIALSELKEAVENLE